MRKENGAGWFPRRFSCIGEPYSPRRFRVDLLRRVFSINLWRYPPGAIAARKSGMGLNTRFSMARNQS
jgi:hypothetical protein